MLNINVKSLSYTFSAFWSFVSARGRVSFSAGNTQEYYSQHQNSQCYSSGRWHNDQLQVDGSSYFVLNSVRTQLLWIFITNIIWELIRKHKTFDFLTTILNTFICKPKCIFLFPAISWSYRIQEIIAVTTFISIT